MTYWVRGYFTQSHNYPMSTANATDTETCTECGDPFTIGYNKAYCCEECYYTAQGKTKLNLLTHDHTICGTCGRIRAVVTPPKPDEAFAIDWSYGSAYNVDGGQVSFEAFGQEESAKAAIGFRQPTEAEEDGACVCGTIGRTDEHRDVLKALETLATLTRIQQRLKDKAIDGECEQWPDKAALFSAFEETGSIEYAVGKAL